METIGGAIVVGVDGSDSGRRALRWAAGQAATGGNELDAVIAWSFEPYAYPGVDSGQAARTRAERILAVEVAAVVAELPSAPPIRQLAIEGTPARVLVEAAGQARMLVVGSHGHGKLFDTLLGSVSTACVRHAVCPVVVVPPDRELPRHAAPRSETAAALY